MDYMDFRWSLLGVYKESTRSTWSLHGVHKDLWGSVKYSCVPERFSHFDALDAYKSFFVNHYADHHVYELITS